MNAENTNKQNQNSFSATRVPVKAIYVLLTISILLLQTIISCSPQKEQSKSDVDASKVAITDLFTPEKVWIAPDSSTIPDNDEGKLIAFGRRLVIHTSNYFGPKGSFLKSGNGLNCQNCHLDAGTKPYGNNLGAVASIYPKYTPRSGSIITIADKINECLTRSMNGDPIDTTTEEMRAFVAYIKWLGKDVKKGEVPAGSGGIKAPHFINRAADPDKGKLVFDQNCARCHGADGQGQFVTDVLKDETKQQGGTATAEDLYYYPPLWGDHSFNGVATLYRLSKFAGFVKHNMPYPITYKNTVLTDEQAWDVAAYVNSRERLFKDHSKDYAVDISKKPYDFPFAPYADNYTEEQHKFGPYTDMPSAMAKH